MGECLIIRSGGGTDTSGATATAARVLSGYTCYVNDSKITGTMTNQGTKNASLNAGGSYTIPAGYHNGSGKVTANALSGQTSGTAGAAHILSDYNAWVNGTNTWGNMPNRGNISHSLPANGTYTVPAGWHAGGGVVNQSLAFHWGGTYTPNTANQVICWANWYAAGNIVVLGSSYLRAENIKKGVNIFNVTGTLDYAEYFTGTAGSMLSRWFISKSVYVSSSSNSLPKFITNGKSLGLSTDNALRIKYESYGSDFSMRIPSYKDYRDLPTGGEFRIWVSLPSTISSPYMRLIQVRYYKIRRYGWTDMDLDNRDVGGTYTFSVGDSSTYGLTTSYFANSISAGSTTQLSTREISDSVFEAVNDKDKFCGYVGLVVPRVGSQYYTDYVYITRITYHPN